MKKNQPLQTQKYKQHPYQSIIDVERYLQNKPAIYNSFYKINLISFVQEIPNIISKSQKTVKQSFSPTKIINQQLNQIQCKENIIESYQHQVDRLNQDIKINQYTLTNLLGRGAHSMVKLAKDSTGETYAIKILWLQKIRKKYFVKQRQIVQMINSEIQILSMCKHKNIISFKQAIYVKQIERMFVVLQNCSQGTILKFMSNFLSLQDKQWWKIAKSFIKQFLQGVCFLHQNNIIHRDIKPENLLINQKNQLKIIDFNISKILKEGQLLKITNKFVGTKSYAAPQIIFDIQKQKLVDGKKVDIWAIGISIIEILQRKHPLPAKSIQQLQKMLKLQIKLNNQYENQLKQMLLKMIAFQPKERANLNQILKSKWFQKN